MTHLNSAVKLLDRAAEKFNDKIAISDEWSEISFSELQRKERLSERHLQRQLRKDICLHLLWCI